MKKTIFIALALLCPPVFPDSLLSKVVVGIGPEEALVVEKVEEASLSLREAAIPVLGAVGEGKGEGRQVLSGPEQSGGSHPHRQASRPHG
jgi:hypothetical protein